MPLSDTNVRNANAQDKALKLFDGGGLFLFVSPAGGKLWRLKYRFQNKEKLLALGAYPDISGSTPKTGASPFIGQFFRQVSDQFTSHFSSTKRAHAGGSFRSCGSHTHAAGSTSFSDENLL